MPENDKSKEEKKNPLMVLVRRLQGTADETTRKLLIKNFLEYHLDTGEELKTRRLVELCNDKFCADKKHRCDSHYEFILRGKFELKLTQAYPSLPLLYYLTVEIFKNKNPEKIGVFLCENYFYIRLA